MSCTVRGVTGSWKAGSSERPLGDASFRGTAEDDSHALQFQNILWRFPAHRFDGVLVAQVQASLGRVIGMGLPGVLFADRGIDASLCANAVCTARTILETKSFHFIPQFGKCGSSRGPALLQQLSANHRMRIVAKILAVSNYLC